MLTEISEGEIYTLLEAELEFYKTKRCPTGVATWSRLNHVSRIHVIDFLARRRGPPRAMLMALGIIQVYAIKFPERPLLDLEQSLNQS